MEDHFSQNPGYVFDDQLYSLTNREWDVLLLLTEDISNAEIADRLDVTPKSVKGHNARIINKLILEGRDHLGRFARKNGEWLQIKYAEMYHSSP